MTRLYIALSSRLRREEGQAMVEYTLILGIISVVAIVALTGIGGDVKTILQNVKSSLDSAV